MFAAEKDGQKIAVEVKGFINPSTINDFHTALGQFLNYRLALQMTDLSRVLYLVQRGRNNPPVQVTSG